ncbi:MAG: YbhB/YbcL family Raf kinase inhibitor-like protein [Cyclobacteriaceae bacterium]|nr:YbhB/YbcL family Raf kinase inhibitor-like protein [Cyclobacteriaceae bacterium]MDH4297653.1 YbhB/YbcL family Raf kinase inhibitor-like protein [Cyclobacteriaceae bacterium]MDH5248236.1 YbhB/YbcL family Raf kinase inhibitor-like protein [Cyclobacteriaceae bacterium]
MPRQTVAAYGILDVSSEAFTQNGTIPVRYACDGDDVSPPLTINKIPAQAKSLALIVEDPDAPGGTWLHWLAWNIPVVKQIGENEVPGDQGMNDFGKISYGGPCPPSGTHRYIFKVYALDDLLDLTEGSSKAELETAMQNHILAHGQLTGVYKRP